VDAHTFDHVPVLVYKAVSMRSMEYAGIIENMDSRRYVQLYSWQQHSGNPSLSTASDSGLLTRRLFVIDRNKMISFLVDTRADLCVYPRKFIRGPGCKSGYELSTANGTIMKIRHRKVNLRFFLDSDWRFYLEIRSRGCFQTNNKSRFPILLWIAR